ncbi:hypothetical protein XFF6990_200014 [Xanthomonas citri pv. fuscans]|uniref:Uncharacterized protein n=1 Tax=Xanthomonas campestris pv. phaseoli TaxID=317013 RepID=A0A7Z7J0X8_XANCH|nr:hypothetical protein XFF6990_200014 [Xanthomonas citri pv. fuscans]SOO25268.1 hypothetical protein XFF6991_430092 [Xanthomonas phaseoli pv. phaseoli]
MRSSLSILAEFEEALHGEAFFQGWSFGDHETESTIHMAKHWSQLKINSCEWVRAKIQDPTITGWELITCRALSMHVMRLTKKGSLKKLWRR